MQPARFQPSASQEATPLPKPPQTDLRKGFFAIFAIINNNGTCTQRGRDSKASELKEIILANKESVNYQTTAEMFKLAAGNLLQLAISHCYHEAVELLLENGANPNITIWVPTDIKNHVSMTPLSYAQKERNSWDWFKAYDKDKEEYKSQKLNGYDKIIKLIEDKLPPSLFDNNLSESPQVPVSDDSKTS